VDFAGVGIDGIRIVGSSWRLDDDPKRRTFHESNAGPHRYFEQLWVQLGDEYELREERVIPSAYNALVEFVYRLGSGDDVGATALVTNASLVATAKELGLMKDPGEPEWYGWCGDARLDAKPPCTVERPDGQRFTVNATKRDRDWLISAIEACTGPSAHVDCQ
jgi:hypothetical protein